MDFLDLRYFVEPNISDNFYELSLTLYGSSYDDPYSLMDGKDGILQQGEGNGVGMMGI